MTTTMVMVNRMDLQLANAANDVQDIENMVDTVVGVVTSTFEDSRP